MSVAAMMGMVVKEISQHSIEKEVRQLSAASKSPTSGSRRGQSDETGRLSEPPPAAEQHAGIPYPSPAGGVSPHVSSQEYFPANSPAAGASEISAPHLETYRVTGVPDGDFLNMRQGPGANYPIVLRLQSGVDGIALLGQPVINGTTRWQQIVAREKSGWVNADFLISSNAAIPLATPISQKVYGRAVPVYPNQNPTMR
jgi:hypothetical protein